MSNTITQKKISCVVSTRWYIHKVESNMFFFTARDNPPFYFAAKSKVLILRDGFSFDDTIFLFLPLSLLAFLSYSVTLL